MKSVSFWARHNTYKARLLIVLSEIFLFVLAVRLGLLLLHSGIQLPGIAVVFPLSILGIATVLTRYRKVLQQTNRRYYLQRLCFFLVGLSMFLLTSFLVNSEKLLIWNTYPTLSGTSVSFMVKPAPSSGYSLFSRQATRLLNKIQKHNALKGLYILLTVVGGLFLLGLVASLSCTLSCNGNGVLAVIVLLAGGGGIIFLCSWIIRKILGKKAPKNEQAPLVTEPVG